MCHLYLRLFSYLRIGNVKCYAILVNEKVIKEIGNIKKTKSPCQIDINLRVLEEAKESEPLTKF